MQYETVIGLEVHAQLLTESKIFCGCSTRFGAPPNSHTCPICLGMPGVLPTLNKKAVTLAVRMGIACGCAIRPEGRFARKNYFYPDLPKGYQISMYEAPIATGGGVEIVVNGQRKKIGLTRIHMEEDAGKAIHNEIEGIGLIDLNRAGVPLIEIVSEPDIRNSDEAAAYLKKLRELLIYTGVSDGDMEKGNFRCDANISLRPVGQTSFGTRAEIKNLNSFRFIQKALEYEITRQSRLLNEGGKITQETRLWDTKKGVTLPMRSKEEAHDYRYFPEPDLVPIQIGQVWIDQIMADMPELADAKRERFMTQYQIPEYDAVILTSSTRLADFYERVVALYPKPKTASNWIMGELLKELNRENKEIDEALIRPEQLVALLTLIDNGAISGKIGKIVFEEVYRSGEDPEKIILDRSLKQVSDESAIERVIEEVLAAHPDEFLEFRSGKEKLFGFFVGQVMKRSGGQAHPEKVNQLLKKRLTLIN